MCVKVLQMGMYSAWFFFFKFLPIYDVGLFRNSVLVSIAFRYFMEGPIRTKNKLD